MAATGTPTPNIGLRIPQGTDPASVDDINYNSNLLDTKLGAVGNTSVQDQIDSLNSKIANVIKYVDTGFFYLNDLTWTATSGGMYQAEIPLPTGVTINGTVVGVMIQRIQSFATDYYVQPFSNQGVPSVLSNKNSFGTGSRLLVRILYIPS